MRRLLRLVVVALFAGVGGCTAWVAGELSGFHARADDHPFLVENSPLPHHVPEHPGGVAFRFAMAHDVLHERFPKHGPAYYRERDRLTRRKLAALAPTDPESFPLADDLAVGLERLGRTDEAITVMRGKLARQQAAGLAGRDLYTSYANLGTFLIHASFKGVMAGDPAARERFGEGVKLVEESVKVNPGAHFGRERWQAAVAQFLLAAADDPTLLRKYDCIGNRIDTPTDKLLGMSRWTEGHGRAMMRDYLYEYAEDPVPAAGADDPARWDDLKKYRRRITLVGAEDGWDKVRVPSHRHMAPFDEPVLGMIGMWRQGGGANPYFALSIGEVMLRVGQRPIAWSAFERAHRLADRYGRDEDTHQFLRDHCRKRQAEIEARLARPSNSADRYERSDTGPPLAADEVAALRPRFDAELAHGEGYQKAYQAYEADRIAAGASIEDPRFWDRFDAGRPPIASPSGPEEWLAVVPRERVREHTAPQRVGWGLFGAGVGAAVGAGLVRLRRWAFGRWRGGTA